MVSQKQPNKRRLIFLMVMAALLITGALLFNGPKQTHIITVAFPSGAMLDAEVADTPEKLLFGLAFRESLPPKGGMLYIFNESAPHQLWTKEFKIPVDIIWVDEGKTVVYVVKGAEPCSHNPCPWYGPPPEDARYVIETNAGFVKSQGVTTGAKLKFILKT